MDGTKKVARTWWGHLVGAPGGGTWSGHLVGAPGGGTCYQHESSRLRRDVLLVTHPTHREHDHTHSLTHYTYTHRKTS